MASTAPGVRLLPNAITVLAMCAGLSAVHFALANNYLLAIGAIGVAAVLDSLDGRIARLLDATSKMGAELDSLSDAISFGVAPALVLYHWRLEGNRWGWIIALVFAVCMILRLARFNTLLDTDQPAYAKEFFVGVPAPAGGLLLLLPLMITQQVGREGWWSDRAVVMLWAVAIAVLLISRIPTLSPKTVRVPAKAVSPLLVLVGLLAAAIITFPLVSLIITLLVYLAHLPFAVHRKHWLAHHPEAWGVPPSERRALRLRNRNRRLGLRPPLGRVAGAARRAVRRPRRDVDDHVARPSSTLSTTLPTEPIPRILKPMRPPRSWRRTGLRREQRPRPSEPQDR